MSYKRPDVTTSIFNVEELANRLVSEDGPGMVYRGQCREFPDPMLPSAYRESWHSAEPVPIEPNSRFRHVGERFWFVANAMDSSGFTSQHAYDSALKQNQLRNFLRGRIRDALGYVLAEAMFQQSGLRSEGVDVTEDWRIALFFATHRWADGRYAPQPEGSIVHLYRWQERVQDWRLADLNAYDYYSCPTLVPVGQLFKAFETCTSASESLASFDRYRRAIGWGLTFDLDYVRGNRPFYLLRFPAEWLETSRIARQKAALLLPDAAKCLRTFRAQNPDGTVRPLAGPCVDDLTSRPNCTSYRLRVDHKALSNALYDADYIFPNDFVLQANLGDWLDTLVANEYGTLPVFPNQPASWSFEDFTSALLSNPERRYFV